MNVKNIILNILGIILYQIIIFYLYISGAYHNKLLLLLILEIYTFIILMHNGQKLLAFFSIINIVVPLNFIFFLINIFRKNIKDELKNKNKLYFINKNKLLLRISPFIILINIFLLIFGFIEFYANTASFKLEVILGYIEAFVGFIFGNMSQDLIYYITKPLAIISFTFIICYYVYLISVIAYFIKRKQPLRAFKIAIFNFFTFSLYSIIYLKNDMNSLLIDEEAKESFKAVHEYNLNMNNSFIKRLLINFFAIFMIVFLMILMMSVSRKDISFVKKISDNALEVKVLGGYPDLTYKIIDEIDEGLYTVQGDLRSGTAFLSLSDEYETAISSLEGQNVEFYNLPINDLIEVSLSVSSIFDFQTLTITKQSDYIDYNGNKSGVYEFNMNTIDELLSEEDFSNVSLYNFVMFYEINIYKYGDDEYDVATTNTKTGKYDYKKYTKEKLLEFLRESPAKQMIIIN